MAEEPPSFQCILEDTKKYMKWLPKEVQPLKKIEIEREVSELKNSLEEVEKNHSELQSKIEELDMKSSSSRDARKMYGDIRPGDTTHQDVMMAYKNFHSNSPRNLLKELPAEADKFKVWEIISDIMQESFKKNKDDIIRRIKDKLHKVLLEDVAKPLDEEITDLIRAFSIFTESVRLESVKQFLLKEDCCDRHAIEKASEIIYKKLHPKHFSSCFQDDCVSESGVIGHGTSKYHESVYSQSRQKDEKEKHKPFWRSKSNSEIETHALAGRSSAEKSPRNKTMSEPRIDTEQVYQKLKDKMIKAIEILELLEEKEFVKKKLIKIEEEIKTMKKRVNDKAASVPRYTLESKHKDTLDLEHKIILKLIEAFIHDLENILTCTSNEYIDGESDTREKYKIYGLVLSACDLKKSKDSKPPENVEQMVLAAMKQKCPIYEGKYDKYVHEAVAITRDMLTLLPPFIITVHPKCYDERLHDTKRPAWDESRERDKRQKLTYYRPILVYGNELHIAVKGTVGNKKHS